MVYMDTADALEIRPQRPFRHFLRRFMPPLVLFFAITTVIAMILIFNSPASSAYRIGLAAGATLTAGLVALLYLKHRRMVNATLLRLSPTGLEMTDQTCLRLQIACTDITHIDDVLTRFTNPNAVPVPPGLVAVRPGTIRALGVIGWGRQDLPANLPRWVRQQLSQAPTNPQTHMVRVAIPLGFLDPHWTAGPAQAYFRRYRPDLLPRLSAPSQAAR